MMTCGTSIGDDETSAPVPPAQFTLCSIPTGAFPDLLCACKLPGPSDTRASLAIVEASDNFNTASYRVYCT